MTYTLTAQTETSYSNQSFSMDGFRSSELMIKFENIKPNGRYEVKSNSFRWEKGERIGSKRSIYYGDTEHSLDVPSSVNELGESETYSLRFFPARYNYHCRVSVYEKSLDIDLGALSEKTGLPIAFLRLQNTQLLQVLEGFNTMASSDTRNLIAQLESTTAKADQGLAAAATAQASVDAVTATVSTVQSVVTDIKESSLIQESFDLFVSMFTQIGNVYRAVVPLQQIDGTKGVQLSLTDSDGEDQGFSQLISRYGEDDQKIAVELTATQYMDNTYPLRFLCQGQRITTVSGGQA